MSDVLVSVFARTDVGMHRSGNEDSFLVADLTKGGVGLGSDVSSHQVGERGSLLIVSDGMGGAAAGEVASDIAVTTIRESIGEMAASVESSERLKSAAEIANERIWNQAQNNPELSGMGATLTAALIQGTTAYLAQVGDSRAYLIRGDQIKQLTKDQSLAQILVDSGAIKPDQMESIPQNVIMQALGTQPAVKVVMSAVELCRNDCLVICSDGLSNKFPRPDELRGVVSEAEDLADACRVLIDKANERGGEDNITVIIARFDGEALRSVGESKSITGSFRPLDSGYFSEYFPGGTLPSQEILPPEPGQQTAAVITEAAPAEEIDDEFSSRPTADRPAYEAEDSREIAPHAQQRQGYTVILIILLISVLLLGATGFFLYSIYLKPKPPSAVPSSPE